MVIKVNLDASPKLVECITGLTAAIQTLAGKKTEKSESEIARELLRTGGKVKSEPAKLDETTPIEEQKKLAETIVARLDEAAAAAKRSTIMPFGRSMISDLLNITRERIHIQTKTIAAAMNRVMCLSFIKPAIKVISLCAVQNEVTAPPMANREFTDLSLFSLISSIKSAVAQPHAISGTMLSIAASSFSLLSMFIKSITIT